MNFSFSVSQLVDSRSIFVVDKALRPAKQAERLASGKKHLSEVIDRLGEASAKAQGLPGAITTSHKLAYTDQRVYLYTDIHSNCVVGFIKVGTKRLFLYDRNGNQRETDPLCILDFYVHESMQRKGYGKKLYEFMIENERVTPVHLAIDKPSDKFLAFLSKHYKLKVTIPQVNNYIVFEGFFTNRKDRTAKRSRRANGTTSPQELSNDPMSVNLIGSSLTETRSIEEIAAAQYRATSNSSTSLSSAEELAALSDIPLARPSSREKLAQCRNSPVTGSAAFNGALDKPFTSQYSTQQGPVDNLSEEVLQLAVTNGARSQPAQNKAYSRHTTLSSAALPHQYSTSNQNDYREPLRSRYGQPNVRPTDKLNTHQHVQNKQGHLKVTPSKLSQHTHSPEKNSVVYRHQDAGDWAKTFHQSEKTSHPHSSWNVFGVPTGYSHIANRKPT